MKARTAFLLLLVPVLAIVGTGSGGAAALTPNNVPAQAAGGASPNVNPLDTPSCNPASELSVSGGTGAFFSNQFESNYVSAPFIGPQDVPNADFTNIFLFPISSADPTWDQFLLHHSLVAPTQEQLDAMTGALVCSSYFDSLSQYNINPPVFTGDEATISTCVSSALGDAASTNNVISYATMRSFAACEVHNNTNNSSQVNVFVAPGVMASSYGEDKIDMCTPGTDGSGSTGGYHGWGESTTDGAVPNWTVVPTSQSCNGNAGGIMDSLSHEMVEAVSDPAGAGWLHSGDILSGNLFDFNQDYDEGELGDICSSIGAYPTPPVDFPSTGALASLGLSGLQVAPYWSDQDNSCEPVSIMNDVLASMSGSPLVRFTGSTHNLDIPINQPFPPPGVVDQLELDVLTGSDNLNSSSSANLVITFKSDGQDIQLPQADINEGAEWASNSFHAVYVAIPPGLTVNEITEITLNTDLSNDNWDVASVLVQADVNLPTGCAPQTLTLVNDNGVLPLGDGSIGIQRMVGGGPDTLPEALMPVPAGDLNRDVTNLTLYVGTSGDDLRGGNSAGDNANAQLNLNGGGSVPFSNINNDANWPNGSTQGPIHLESLTALPPGLTVGQLASFDIQTDLPGGASGDNWDVSSILLLVTTGCAQITPPTSVTQALAVAPGGLPLPDGSTGQCRETQSQQHCHVAIPAPVGFNSSDQVTSLSVTVTTGSDDLRGGSYGTDNANAVVGGQTFPNINQFQDWSNGSVNTVQLNPSPPLTLGSVTDLDLMTQFGGGLGGDNWDIAAVSITGVIITNPGATMSAVTSHSSGPAGPTVNLVHRTAGPSGGPSNVVSCGTPPCATPAMLTALSTDPSPWSVVPSASLGPNDNVLNGVTCATPVQCFAVGYETDGAEAPQAVIELGNGGAWTPMPTPATGNQYSVLNGVSCITPTDCIAVGYDGSGGIYGVGGIAQELVETWDGTKWSVTVNGNPSGDVMSVLNSVSCTVGKTFCMAAGYDNTTGVSQTLVQMFSDQGAWVVSPTPDPPLGDSILNGVSCPATNYCVAVGMNDASGVAQTLLESWNGSSWVIQPSPNGGSPGNVFYGMGDNDLYSVSCSTTFSCVAVGTDLTEGRVPQTLVVTQVAGQGWQIGPSDNPGSGGDVLSGVSCIAPNNCTAVGFESDGAINQTLNENWDGTKWFDTPIPSPGSVGNFMMADWCTNSPAGCAGVGQSGNVAEQNQSLALNFTPTPPNAPTSATAQVVNSGVSVSFVTPTDNGGSEISSYTVTAADSTTPTNGGQVATATSSPITVTGLSDGDSYTFTVTATNATGTGPASAPSNAVTPTTLPGAPGGVTATATGTSGEADVGWSTPILNGASVSSYTVTSSPPCLMCTGLSVSGSPVPTSTTVDGLTDGTSYTFSVTATNASGNGPAGTSAPVVPGSPPGSPGSVSAAAGYQSVETSWIPPPDDGSSILSYQVTATPTMGSPISQTFGPSATSGMVGGLTNGTAYSVSVVATNGFGPGPAASATGTVTPSSLAPHITSSVTGAVGVGQHLRLHIAAVGTPRPVISQSAFLPSWLTFTPGTGSATLVGTPPVGAGGQVDLSFTASGGAYAAATQSFVLSVLEITSAPSATFQVGQPNIVNITTNSTPGVPTISTLSALPSGVSLIDDDNGTATLVGTPAPGTAKNWRVQVVATSGSATTIQRLTLADQLPPTITSGATVNAAVGHLVRYHVTVTGFPVPTLTETSPLPSWLSFTVVTTPRSTSALLSGMPPPGSGGNVSLSLVADNGVGAPATQTLNLGVLEITSSATGSVPRGAFDVFTIKTSDAPAPVTLRAAPLPPGMTFVDNGDGTGTISGTPTGLAKTYRVVVAANSGTDRVTQTLNLTTT